MTAASDLREELEATLWRHSIPAPLVASIMAAADAYAKAARPRSPKPPAPKKPRAVHYALPGRGNPACRPFDLRLIWAVSNDLQAVTCGHCRKLLAEAAA